MTLKVLLAGVFVLLMVVPLVVFVTSLSSHAQPLCVTVHKAPFEVRVQATGSLEAVTSEPVTARSSGNVLTWIIPEGQTVHKDDVLCRFEDVTLQDELADRKVDLAIADARVRDSQERLQAAEEDQKAQVTMLEAQLAIVQTEYNRLKTLPRKEDLDRARLDLSYAAKCLDTAAAELEQFKRLVDKGLVMTSELRDKELAFSSAQADKTTAEIQLRLVEEGATQQQLETARLQMEQVKIDLDQARRELPERLRLFQADVDRVGAEQEKAKNRLDRTQQALDDTQVKSPADGMLVYRTLRGRKIQLGDSFWWSAQLFDIVDLSHMRVRIKVLESEVRSVKEGQLVQVRAVTIPDKVLRGTVTKVVRVAKDKSEGELMTRSQMRTKTGVQAFDVEVTLDEIDPLLRPNVGASVSILIDRFQDVISVPLDAVAKLQDQPVVHVVHGGSNRVRPVVLGLTGNDWVVVTEGLKEGERVLLSWPEMEIETAAQTPKQETASPGNVVGASRGN